MRMEFKPSLASGSVAAPPSKSMAHRLLILAALAEGESEIRNPGLSEDVLATVDCLRALGAKIGHSASGAVIRGCDPGTVKEPVTLACRESGSTLRFLLPTALLSGQEIRLTGSKRLLARPLSVYEALCRRQGLLFEKGADMLRVCGRLQPGCYEIPGNVSSQFATGLLLALPLLPGDSTLRLTGSVESRPYLEMSLDALERFDVRIEREEDFLFRIPGGQRPKPQRAEVEGDWSNAAFFLALNRLGGAVTVTGLDPESRQGDCAFGQLAQALGTREISLRDCPDLGPILFALAAAGPGGVLTGTRRLQDKESDRCMAMAAELRKLGAEVSVEEDSVEIRSGELHRPSVPLFSHNDHRVAMALSVLLSRFGGSLEGAECVKKSFPAFFDCLQALHVQVRAEQ